MAHIAKRILFGVALTLSLNSFGANILFDLGGVLFDTNEKVAFSMFWKELAAYMATFNNPAQAQTRLFEILIQLKPLEHPEIDIRDDGGRVLPQQLRDWLCSAKPNSQILEEILDGLRNHPELYHNRAEQPLMEKVVTMMFSSHDFIKTRIVIPEGVAFARECLKQGHKLYALSNWDAESFELLLRQHPDIFNLFEGIIISGTVGTAKPDKTIFISLLEEYNLNPAQCIFLDDQPENIQAAAQLGIHTIHVTKSAPFYAPWSKSADFGTVRSTFKKLIKKIA